MKNTFLANGVDPEKPQSRFLAPDISFINKVVADYYAVSEDTLVKVRRGISNEPRDLAVYLSRRLRGEPLVEPFQLFQLQFSQFSNPTRDKKNA